MAVAEIFLTTFIAILFEKLASGELIRLARYAGIYAELNKWNQTLTQIRAVLVDAGQKHISSISVQTWLNKLQHLAYDIDDVLDDLATEASRRQLDQASYSCTSKVLKIIPDKFHAFEYGRKMKSKLHAITTKLNDLVKEKKLLGLNDNVESSIRASRPLEQTSLVDVSTIVGRDGDKEVLLGKLLGNETSSQKVSVVSIVGMGGIGKTTLAQMLYNDEKVKAHFKHMMSWVSVPDDFDVFKISKAIYTDVGGDANKNFETLNQLQVALRDILLKKIFLVVLDDVWNEDYNKWELLQRPFAEAAHGSKVLVTTRKGTVASVLDSAEAYSLEILSDKEAKSLFSEHALGKQNFDLHPFLKSHGEEFVKRCGGLPIALKTLGRVLRTKSHIEEWEDVLNSEIWNLQSPVLPSLRLSYYDLPPHLKQMFTYCCLFPKNYLIQEEGTVLLWMAEGFLYESNSKKSMESLGRECFQELVSRSLF